MENKIQLTTEDLGLLELALDETINVLKNRFKEEIEYIHPAKKYEDLYDRLTRWSDPLPVSVYTLSAVKDNSAYSGKVT